MLDIKFVRENPETVRADLRKRGRDGDAWIVDDLLAKDRQSRALKVEIDRLRQRRNSIAREINEARKAGRDCSDLLREASRLPEG